jgi:hypothetical protein
MQARGAAGAYGLTFPGLERCAGLLASPGPSWPDVRVERALIRRPPGPTRIEADRAEIRLIGGGQLRLDRLARMATYLTATALPDDELVHPYLAPVASSFAGWLGRQALHAGAARVDGTVLAFAGRKEAGKTTTMAWLASRGYEVVADDVLVVDGERALAGPRALDLRLDAARELDMVERTREHRGGERRRLELGPIAHELPLGGFVFLAWGAEVEITALPPGERLARLAGAVSTRTARAGGTLLDLTRFPAWELRRPRDLEPLPEALDRLLEVACG